MTTTDVFTVLGLFMHVDPSERLFCAVLTDQEAFLPFEWGFPAEADYTRFCVEVRAETPAAAVAAVRAMSFDELMNA